MGAIRKYSKENNCCVHCTRFVIILGAGSLVGIDVYQSALLAGIMGVAHVVEMLARKYIDDGKITLEEVNEVFNAVPTRK